MRKTQSKTGMKKKGFRSFAAMLVLTSMLLENTAQVSVFAAENAQGVTGETSGTAFEGDAALQEQSGNSAENREGSRETHESLETQEPHETHETQEVHETTESSGANNTHTGSEENPAGGASQAENSTGGTSAEENSTGTVSSEENTGNHGSETDPSHTGSGNFGTEPGENGNGQDAGDNSEQDAGSDNGTEQTEADLRVSDDGRALTGSGLDQIELTIDASELSDYAYYRLYVDTKAAATCNGAFIDSAVNGLNKNTTTVRISDLNKESFVIYAAGESSDRISAEYTVTSVQNKTAHVRVYDSGEEQPKGRLNVDGRELHGIGYEELTLELAMSGEEGPSPFSCVLFVQSDAEGITANGEGLNDGSIKLGGQDHSVRLSGLANRNFRLSLLPGEDYTGDIYFTRTDEENALVSAQVNYAYDETIHEYTWEDEYIKITAIPKERNILPGNAVFHAVKLEPGMEKYEAYLRTVNENAQEERTLDYTNSLVYDMGFFTDDTYTEEIEPADGAVSISVIFKQGQLKDILGAETEDDRIEIDHIVENDGSLQALAVESEA